MRIGIVGAGHAGLAAAQTAASLGAEVVLFSNEPVLPYFRPRLVEFAFEETDFTPFLMHPAEWYSQNGITLHLDSPVQKYEFSTRTVVTPRGAESFDALVLATGSSAVVPHFLEGVAGICPLWTERHAERIRERIKANQSGGLAIIGGGILGIEAALRAVRRGIKVCVIEKMNRLMPNQFETEASTVLQRLLESKGITVMTGRSVLSARDEDSATVTIELDGGDRISAALALIAVGARCDLSLVSQAGIDSDRGILVNESLMTSREKVFACGDVVQLQTAMRCSVQEASAQGKIAGVNAVSVLKGEPLKEYTPAMAPVSFKLEDFEIFSAGEIKSERDEVFLLGELRDTVYQSLITREGTAVGLQMVGDRTGYQKYLKMVQQKSVFNGKEQ